MKESYLKKILFGEAFRFILYLYDGAEETRIFLEPYNYAYFKDMQIKITLNKNIRIQFWNLRTLIRFAKLLYSDDVPFARFEAFH